MALVTVSDTTLTDIADAIRAKNGQETLYKPSEMPDAIEAIGGGGITPTGTISITENGTYDVTSYASANVNTSLTLPGLTYLEFTPEVNITSSNKLSIQLPIMTEFAIVVVASSVPEPDSELYWALSWVKGFWSGGGGNKDATSAILRPAGTVGSDYEMCSYNTSTGVLQLGGQYGYFKAGLMYRIYAIDLTP